MAFAAGRNRALHALRAAVVLAPLWLLASACILDWERDGAGRKQCASGELCTCDPGEPCEYTCVAGSCAVECAGATRCEVLCVGGSCDVTGTGADECRVNCVGGACVLHCTGDVDCTMSCLGGGCDFDCPQDTSCTPS